MMFTCPLASRLVENRLIDEDFHTKLLTTSHKCSLVLQVVNELRMILIEKVNYVIDKLLLTHAIMWVASRVRIGVVPLVAMLNLELAGAAEYEAAGSAQAHRFELTFAS